MSVKTRYAGAQLDHWRRVTERTLSQLGGAVNTLNALADQPPRPDDRAWVSYRDRKLTAVRDLAPNIAPHLAPTIAADAHQAAVGYAEAVSAYADLLASDPWDAKRLAAARSAVEDAGNAVGAEFGLLP